MPKRLDASNKMVEMNRLRRARISKARSQRRSYRREEPPNQLIRTWSVLKSVAVRMIGVWSVLTSIALSAFGTLLFLGLFYLLYQAVTSSAIEVAPISVPKKLADKGYTSEAVTLQLREALLELIKEARTEKRTANVVSLRDEPTIDLPQTGMSLDTVAAEIRDRFGFGNSWRVSSSIESIGDNLTLSVSLDGQKEHRGFDVNGKLYEINVLFSSAAESIFGIIDRYVLAASYLDRNMGKSAALAREIILSHPKNDSNVAWAHVLMSYIQHRSSNKSEAAKEVRAAITIDNNIAVAHNNLAMVFLDEGENEKAFEELREAIWLNNSYATAYNNLGNLLEREGERRLAIEAFNRAIQLDPNNSNAHDSLGSIFLTEGQYDAALEEFAKAIASDFGNSFAHANLAEAYASRDKLDAAIEEYNRAIIIDPRFAEAHFRLGRLLEKKGKLSAARDEYDESVAIDPDNPAYLAAQKNTLTKRDRQPPPGPDQAQGDTAAATPPQPP
jgi:tetratricopeptide (TPR) repeat protein